jgi:hypothetical protein
MAGFLVAVLILGLSDLFFDLYSDVASLIGSFDLL